MQCPHDAGYDTLADYLFARFPDDVARLRERVTGGEVVDELGRPYSMDSPYPAGGLVFLYRDPEPEDPVPFDVEVLHQDDNLVVVDKPHFLAVTPRGAYVRETVLVRLRERLGLPELSPAHRIDRPTAGVLLLTTRREVRRPYQDLFAQRTVRKVYEAVAPIAAGLDFPVTVRSRILKQHGVLQAAEVAGEPNAESRIDLVRRLGQRSEVARGRLAGDEPAPELGLFRLEPKTGRTHQLRVHMASLGMPIRNDDLYPEPILRAIDDYSAPLQLLARSISFVDPRTGQAREFASLRQLGLASGPV